jgi:hypothetical protein
MLTVETSRVLPTLDRIALIAVLLLPLLLLHAHGIGEVAIAIADLCFLGRAVLTRQWEWLRAPWIRIGLAWWGWTVLCSLPLHWRGIGAGGLPSLTQAIFTVRFLVLVAALEHVVLREPAPRRWLYWIMGASAAYIAVQSLVQFTIGYNLYGEPPAGGRDAESLVLTGPFGKQRAGPPLSRILLPVLVPQAVRLLRRRRILASLGAGALLTGGVGVMVLIGQRIPLLLVALGLLVVALLLRPLRYVVVVTGVAGLLLLAATPAVAPATYRHLVLKFTDQVTHFATSPYGELYARALEIGTQNGATGLGSEGFNYGCPEPRYFRPTFDGSIPDGGGATICWHHPHNFYFEALDNGGFVGLALFCAMAMAWLLALGHGLRKSPDPLRVGLFAAAFIQLWPIASTSGFTSMPMGGWFFLLLGWGLAETRWQRQAARSD